jgi:Fe2+ or Zn2+ uptake regulation protein
MSGMRCSGDCRGLEDWPQARDLNGFALERVDVVYRGTCATCREQRDSA